MNAVDDLRTRFAAIQERVDGAARAAGRDPQHVRIIAASKTVDAVRLRDAYAAGIRTFGENRAQELCDKAPQLSDLDCEWHFIGSLQRNKVRMLAPWVRCWHSVDRLTLATELAERVPGAAVLIEVNTSGEAAKAGVALDAAPALVEAAQAVGLTVLGLMTVPAAAGDPRPAFAALRQAADALGLPECSMGMSDDFEAAIAEGATMIRLGRILFGDRPAPHAMPVPD